MRKLLHLLFYLIPCCLSAQNSTGSFAFSQLLKGVSPESKSINTVFQDHRGFLWMGTRKGLCRYDGANFVFYNTLGPGGITDWIVTCIAEDKKGKIWFGTENGLNRLDPLADTITRLYAGTGFRTIPFSWCNQLYKDSKGRLWLGTEKGLALYDESKESFTNFPVQLFGKDERINKFIKEITEDSAGNLWLATSYGIKRFDPEKKSFTHYGTGETPADNVIYSVYIDRKNHIWAGSFSGALFRLNTALGSFQKMATASIGDISIPLTALHEIMIQEEPYVMAASMSGLFYLKNDGTSHSLQFSAQPGKMVLQDIYTDAQQRTWIGSSTGLYLLNRNSFAFSWLTIPGLPGNEPVYHIIPQAKKSQDFYLTSAMGWWNFNSATGELSRLRLPVSSRKILEYINDWVEESNGYWFSSVNGFGHYNPETNRLTDLSELIYHYSGQYTTGFIAYAGDSKYWVTMRRSGILEYNAATGTHRQLFADKNNKDHTYGLSISDLQLNSRGQLFFISGGRLYRVNPADLSYTIFTVPENKPGSFPGKSAPQRLYFGKNGDTYIISQLYIYRLLNDSLVKYYPSSSTSINSIEKIMAAENGRHWIFSGQELFNASPDFLQWKKMDFLPGWSDTTVITDLYSGLKGKTIFSSRGTIGVLNNDILLPQQAPPTLLISRVQTGSQQVFLPPPDQLIATGYKNGIQLDLSPLSFGEDSRIFYQLKGWDEQWHSLHNTSSVRYEQLPPGFYTFVAKSVNTSGQESNVTTLQLKVTPPFYRSFWFISLAVLLAGVSAYGFHRYQLTKAVELEKLRTRIATDLHDDIGASLSSISMYSESIKLQVKESLPHLEPVLTKMGENSRDMVAGMSDIVWAINPGNDAGEKMIQRMESYATDTCAAKEIRLHFTADKKLGKVQLPLEKRKNIYLIFKEAVNNAAKYSAAKNLHILLRIRENDLVMEVLDDGEGFDIQQPQKGNGLTNMTLRANEMKGQLSLHSAQGQGTKLMLEVRIL